MLALNQKQGTLKLKEHLENTTNPLVNLQPGTYKDHGPYLANKNVWEMSEVGVKGKDCGGTVDGGAGWGSCKDKTQRICVCLWSWAEAGGSARARVNTGIEFNHGGFWFRQPKQSRALRTAYRPQTRQTGLHASVHLPLSILPSISLSFPLSASLCSC